jgi:hypothetical protein
MTEQQKVLNFPKDGNLFPPAARIRALYFYGPPIQLPDGQDISPCARHNFDTPATEAEAWKVISGVAERNGITGDASCPVFIPWPCLVYFEFDRD